MHVFAYFLSPKKRASQGPTVLPNFEFSRCATETNIWKRLKRIVELKKDHETARKEMEKKQIGSAINFLSDLIEEWDTIIYR